MGNSCTLPNMTALPAHPATFVGRERQLADVRRLLEGSRLVTLTGPGGTGKTRLALRLAELCTFDRPTIFVPLGALAQPDLVPLAIAEALGVAESTGRTTEEAVLAALCGRAALLILDNLEHLLAAPHDPSHSVAALVARLLADCPHIRVLATSREALRLSGEQVYAVPPLTLGEGSEAVRLFLDRARAASGFAPSAEDEADVAEICRRLDGLPLAIELAAARTAVLSPAALRRRLEQRLPLLTGGPRDLPERQQTLRGAIAWSYDLLSPDEQTLFRRLAAIHGGATLDAVASVCLEPDRTLPSGAPGGAPLDDVALLGLLQSLSAKSVIVIDRDDDGEPRFGMLETVREFALEQLSSSAESAVSGDAAEEALVRRRHADFFLELARQRLDKRHTTSARLLRGRMEREHDNLRAALEWCLATRDVERALALSGALWVFWSGQRHFSEGRKWLDRVLVLADELLPDSPPHAARARALLGAAWLAYKQGDPIARRYGDRAVTLYRALGDPTELATALRWVSCVYEYERGMELARESLALNESLGDDRGRASALVLVGELARVRGDYAAARAAYEESLAVVDGIDGEARPGRCVTIANLGYVTLRTGDAAEAAQLFETSLREEGPYAEIISGFAGCALAMGDPERAARLLGGIQAHLDARGEVLDPPDRAEFLRDYQATRAALGDAAFDAAYEAGRLLDEAALRTLALQWRSCGAPDGTAGAPDAVDALSVDEAASRLSRRELEVAALLARGHTNRQIARDLVISERTAANHVEHILTKLGFRARTQIAAWAAQHGLK